MVSETHTLRSFHLNPGSEKFTLQSTSKSLPSTSLLIRTTHSGICFTDVHAKSSGCGLGHEGIGHVVSIGSAISHFQSGDRVGWGWLHSSCGHCSTCVSGYRQYCSEARGFAFSDQDQGAFGDFRIIDAKFAYRIPEAISSVHAAPLMCAGASVYEALDAAGTKSHDRVGVVGIGGLGHMACLFAKAMGCSVTAISNSPSKRADAFKLGADEFRELSDLSTVHRSDHLSAGQRQDDGKISTLLLTSNATPDLALLLPLLARRATIILMTIQQDALTVPYMPFVLPGHRLIASTEASRENHIRMLEFAARNVVVPWVEEFEMNAKGVANAFERLECGHMRYRGVLVRGEEGEL
ncbi:unnamed protein product [Zymoseptoria tritici ST99CH_3D7]|uniref:Enoyl reductase (ER) domain-containing protein n=1 Tax=Zymoseptoria tritici (strain ST99CH_3D7) TaxID=1276538 RepID=A0A1X7SA38_ZYMT9|nr:unnamed protein product [Zymoseptoria tritici ST99CH_3D7]